MKSYFFCGLLFRPYSVHAAEIPFFSEKLNNPQNILNGYSGGSCPRCRHRSSNNKSLFGSYTFKGFEHEDEAGKFSESTMITVANLSKLLRFENTASLTLIQIRFVCCFQLQRRVWRD